MKLKKLLVITVIISYIVFASRSTKSQSDGKKNFHTAEELSYFTSNKILSPIGPGEYFQLSSSCRGCHGTDSAGVANIDEDGNDVNLFDHWQSTMMANSARDPLWRAKVSHEILVNPAHANDLQNKCTSCHAPMGRYTSFYHGFPNYGLNDLITDSLGNDGVSCAGCHTIGPGAGAAFSGDIAYDTTRNIYGPFTSPLTGPMQLYEGYTPNFGAHTQESRMCASCHTLITETADLSGNYTGGSFVEQATYHEYLNSDFPANNIKCQTCHMPQLSDAIIIANGFASLNPRSPFNQHVFAGSNYFMINLIKQNKSSLGITTEDFKFDTTLQATSDMLRQNAVNFSVMTDSFTIDTAYFKVKIENKAGHKFPSGYPARRAVIQFVVTGGTGNTIFESGIFDSAYRVVGETPAFEPHHNIINQSNVSQIYELVMGDVNFNFTSVLERSANLLKDNRIPPQGFTTAASMYDTVKISNDALGDNDFNQINSVQGTAIDYVHYNIPVTGNTSNLTIRAKIYFQSVPPKWVDEMFTYSSAEIDTFMNMFNSADQTPFLIAEDSIVNISLHTIHQQPENTITIAPSISTDGNITLKSADPTIPILKVEVIASDGKKVFDFNPPLAKNYVTLKLPKEAGIYYLKIIAGSKVYVKKALRL